MTTLRQRRWQAASTVAILTLVALVTISLQVERTDACGGFFCQQVPIDQAGEQIIFRQDGDQVTAVVLIQYAGTAEDFSWVVPVPGIPDLSTGSDLVFSPLELATRPQFNLEVTGEGCPIPFDDFPLSLSSPDASEGASDADDGVEILQSLAVGPFDVQIVSSDDPEALATWLEENEYDLTDRGQELIAPYVEDGMNFVALRLRQDQGVGDLQPLIMRYTSTEPMIPIRLTAVAAEDNMGIIVWLLGEARAVPLNYLHVTPNYTRLDWYSGTTNAYASYQGLVTAAMDEAGGQGFATDFAGRFPDLLSQLPTVESLTDELIRLASVDGDAEFVAALFNGFVFGQDKILEILRRVLPLPEGEGEFIYQVPDLLGDVFTADELNTARSTIVTELNTTEVDTLEETLAVFDGDPYMTRMYTTLSPEEMTLDPCFSYNTELEDQRLDRNATMDVSCVNNLTHWTLTLGEGTGRDGELVIEGTGTPPSFSGPPIEVLDQAAVWRTETLRAVGAPELDRETDFDIAQVDDGSGGTGGGIFTLPAFCGNGAAAMLFMTMIGLHFMRNRRSQ